MDLYDAIVIYFGLGALFMSIACVSFNVTVKNRLPNILLLYLIWPVVLINMIYRYLKG